MVKCIIEVNSFRLYLDEKIRVAEMRFEGELRFYRFMFKLVIYNECLFNKSFKSIHHL